MAGTLSGADTAAITASLATAVATAGLGVVVAVAGGMVLFLSWRNGLKEKQG